jgi:hypothetical protein
MIGKGKSTWTGVFQVSSFAWKLGDNAASSRQGEDCATIDLGIHPKHAGDPMCLCPDLATASAGAWMWFSRYIGLS